MNQTLEKLSEAYTSALMEKFNDELFWEKPWFSVNRTPVNLRGTGYCGANLFLLSLITSMKNYELPVFLTYNQAQKMDATVHKGEKGYPVQRYIVYYITPNGKYMPESEFEKLPEAEKELCQKRVKLSSYTVFNIAQTNVKEVKPKIYDNLYSRYINSIEHTQSGKNHELLNSLIDGQKWICPIHERQSNEAYYSPLEHHIVLPLREQFYQMEQFYSTALHEMAHSTKHKSSIGRQTKVDSGVDPYGHEELIAELSAGLTGLMIGVEQTPQKNNLAYLKSWLENIKQQPNYIFNCLTDAKNISKYMCENMGVDIKKSINQEIDDISIPKEMEKHSLSQKIS